MKAKKRNSLPDSAFVFPSERKYPVNDLAHAKAALRLSGRDTPARQKKVRAVVFARFPALRPKGSSKGSS